MRLNNIYEHHHNDMEPDQIGVMQVINVEALIHKSEQEEHIEDGMSEQSMVSMWR